MPRPENAGPLVVAHRGAWGSAPQNSLEALEAAITLGCDGIEMDVRRTADGRLVIVHDARVRGRPVASLEHEQLQARMRAGQAPLLEDVLRRAAGRITVDIELKEDGYVEAAMEVVTRHLAPDQYVVTSFRAPVLAQVGHLVPEARTGLLMRSARRLRDLPRRVGAARAGFLAPHFGLIRTGTFGWAAQHGLDLWVWTVNDPRILRTLHAQPAVAAVITDRPARAMALLSDA